MVSLTDLFGPSSSLRISDFMNSFFMIDLKLATLCSELRSITNRLNGGSTSVYKRSTLVVDLWGIGLKQKKEPLLDDFR